ncbi:MAG: FtsX-like permease family protein [Deltaproteobacteria bacterium]|nr:FtsX-like permease family protein [Deltaproteobacteria bacterium]
MPRNGMFTGALRSLISLVALRHLRLSPLRSFLTLSGIALSISALTAIASANRAVLESFRGTMGHISGKVDVEVGDGDAPLKTELLDKLAHVSGITHVSPVVSAKSRFVEADGKSSDPMLVLGVDLTGDDYFRTYASAEGEIDPLEFLNCTNCVMLSTQFASAHGIKAGGTVKLTAPSGVRDFKVKALLKDEGPALAFGGNLVIMYLDAAQIAFEREDRYDRIDVALDKTKNREQVLEAIRAAAGPGIVVEEPARRGERTERMMSRFQTALELTSGVAMFVAMFMIYNTIGIAVAQRRREIGVLRALGVTEKEVQLVFVGEAMVLGLVGSVLGVGLGQVLARVVLEAINTTISSLYVQLNVQSATVGAETAIAAVIAGVSATALSAYLPARDASRTPPALSMAKNAMKAPPAFAWKKGAIIALVLAALCYVFAALPVQGPIPWTAQLAMLCALLACAAISEIGLIVASKALRRPFFFLFSVPGALAADNSLRQGSRAVITVAALMVGISLGFGTSTFANGFQESIKTWLEQSVPADLFITGSSPLASQQSTRLPASLLEELEALDGAAGRVEAVNIRKLNYEDLRVTLIAIDFDLRLKNARPIMLEGAALDGAKDMVEHEAIMVSENLSQRKNLHPGDTVRLNTPTGMKAYAVRGVYVDYTSDQGVFLIDRSHFTRDFLDETVETYELYLGKDAALRDRLKAQITQKFGKRYDLFVLTNGEFKQEIAGVVEQSFRATSAMSILAILVALLGVVNTLFAAVIDRTRELGVLRAVGMSTGQIVLALILEGAVLACAALGLSFVCGSALGMLFVKVLNVQGTGWRIGFHPPYSYHAMLSAISLACAALAAAWPAYRAAKMKVVQALSYE